MNAPRWVALALLIVVAALPFVAPFFANELVGERILRFHSDIVVSRDGSLVVAETITVRTAGDRIKHGIYRDFPTEYRGRDGRSHRVPFEILAVERDSQPEPHLLADRENGKRLYVGRENVVLPPGTYTYRLVYRTKDQLGRFADHTELYWNVTGNGWAFPIDRAGASLALPPGTPADALELSGYTGRQGATDRYLRHGVSEDGVAWFQTTRPLAAGQGLTIVASWPRPQPEAPTPAGWIREQRLPALAGLAVAALLLYYLGAWLIVGKDPAAGPIAPLYEPPAGLSPAAMRYLRRMGFDDKSFAVALVDLAVRHAVRIEQVDGVYTVRRNGAAAGDLPPEGAQALGKLLAGQAEVRLTADHHAEVSAARQALRSALDARYGRGYFRRNGAGFWVGVLLSLPPIVMLAALASAPDGRPLAEHGLAWLAVFGLAMPLLLVVLTFLVATALRRWRVALFGGPKRLGAAVDALALGAFSALALAFASLGVCVLAAQTSDWAILAWAALMALHVTFQAVLPAPTALGRSALDRIEGFRRYLDGAGRDHLTLLNPPDRTPELFERYLPYALALDVEGAWGEQFSAAVAAGSRAPAYRPLWYQDTGPYLSEPASFACSLGDGLSGAISSAATPPGSSSGGGDDGSSGGGGGGGGGGGW